MKRRLLTLFPVVSLALCLAICVLWIAESLFRFGSAISYVGMDHRYDFDLFPHEVSISRTTYDADGRPASNDTNRGVAWSTERWPPNFFAINDPRYGIGFIRYKDDIYGGPTVDVAVAYPLIASIFLAGALPLAWRMIHRQKRPGSCLRCGYDLRATPERCPECGAVPAKSAGTMTA